MRALITGITGQDGSYLAELLLQRGVEVHGLVRRSSVPNTVRIATVLDRLTLHDGDMLDAEGLSRVVAQVQPDRVYNLAAQSHVGVSFRVPAYTAEVTYLGALRLLEACRSFAPQARIYQASSSEMFGHHGEGLLDEQTSFRPRSPYAVAKVAAFHQAVNYREAYGMHISNGILFNHESPRRGESFVTRKITQGLARILAGQQSSIALGNLDARRDWGYAPDYVEAMAAMTEADAPGDFVVATGVAHSVRDFVHTACELVERDPNDVVTLDPTFLRPTEVPVMRGDAKKAARELGWAPRTSFRSLVAIMLSADLVCCGLDPARYPSLLGALDRP